MFEQNVFRQLIWTYANCLGRISKTNQYNIFLSNLATFNWPWYHDIRLVTSLYLFLKFSDATIALGLFTSGCNNMIAYVNKISFFANNQTVYTYRYVYSQSLINYTKVKKWICENFVLKIVTEASLAVSKMPHVRQSHTIKHVLYYGTQKIYGVWLKNVEI